MRRVDVCDECDVDEQEQDEMAEAQRRLQARIMRGAAEAITKLRRVARGQMNFMSEHEARACVALARIARLLIVKIAPPEPERQLAHPDHSPEEIEQLLDVVEGKETELQ